MSENHMYPILFFSINYNERSLVMGTQAPLKQYTSTVVYKIIKYPGLESLQCIIMIDVIKDIQARECQDVKLTHANGEEALVRGR